MTEKRSGTKRPITLRRVLPIAAALLLFALVFVAPAAADTYYVSPEGTGDGSESNHGSLSDAITTAPTNGERTIILADGAYTMPDQLHSTGNPKNIVITGSRNAEISIPKIVYATDLSFTFDGVTLKLPESGTQGFAHISSLTYKNCNIIGKQYLYSPTVLFEKCTLENKNNYCVRTWVASGSSDNEITFTDCTFNTGGKALLVYNEWSDNAIVNGVEKKDYKTTVYLTNCIFNDDNTLKENDGSNLKKAAVEVGSSPYSSNRVTHKIIITNCITYGYSPNKSTSPLWGNKNSMDEEHLIVTIDGVEVTKSYTVSWTNYNDTELKPSEKLVYGTTPTYESTPARDEDEKYTYIFAGWSPEILPVTGDVTYKATYTEDPKEYTITINTDGGNTIEPIKQKYGTAIKLPIPTKEGYTFDGWDQEIPATMPAKNIEVKAQWKINQYTITFNTDGGNIIEPITQDYKTEVKAPADPTKEGHTFDGWDKAIPATMPAEDMEIKAQWKVNQYTITISDGDKELKSITQDYGTEVKVDISIPTKEGYVFKGWEPAIPTKMPAEKTEVKAQWEVKEEKKEESTGTTETAGSTTKPEVPGNFAEEGEKTVFTPTNAEEAPVVEKTGEETTVTIPVASGVTLTLTSTEDVSSGAGNSVTGKFDTVEATFANKAADVTTSEKPISYGLVIPLSPEVLKTGDVPLPTIDSTFREDTGSKVANHEGNSYKALSMITATHTNGITAVNSKIVGEITVTFTLPASIAQNIVVFHVKDGQEKPVLLKTEMKRDRVTGDIIITAKGDGFSSYVVAQDTTPRSGSSTPQGSSVWLTESQTPTQTPSEQPTEKPTDSAPTDVPTTQPTQTETETPGFGVFAVLAGLGAVAVLRRK